MVVTTFTFDFFFKIEAIILNNILDIIDVMNCANFGSP